MSGQEKINFLFELTEWKQLRQHWTTIEQFITQHSNSNHNVSSSIDALRSAIFDGKHDVDNISFDNITSHQISNIMDEIDSDTKMESSSEESVFTYNQDGFGKDVLIYRSKIPPKLLAFIENPVEYALQTLCFLYNLISIH